MATNNEITIVPPRKDEGVISDEDIAWIRASLEGKSESKPEVNAPPPNASIPFAPNESDLETTSVSGGASPNTVTTTPYQEPSTTSEVLSGVGRALAPLTGGISTVMMIPKKIAENKKKVAQDRDIKALEFLDNIMKENPRQFGELIKTPSMRDALIRQHGATAEDITEISKIMADPKATNDEKIRALASQGMWDDKTQSIVPRLSAAEQALAKEIQDDKDFASAFFADPQNKDATQLDMIMSRNQQKFKNEGATDTWHAITSGDKIVLYNEKGEVNEIDNKEWVDLSWNIVANENGTFGLVGVSKKWKIVNGQIQPPGHVYIPIEKLMKGAPKRDLDLVKGNAPGWKEVAKEYAKRMGIDFDAVSMMPIDPADPMLDETTPVTPENPSPPKDLTNVDKKVRDATGLD